MNNREMYYLYKLTNTKGCYICYRLNKDNLHKVAYTGSSFNGQYNKELQDETLRDFFSEPCVVELMKIFQSKQQTLSYKSKLIKEHKC